MFAQAECHMEPEMQVCKCTEVCTTRCVCVCVVLLAVSTSLPQRGRLLSADKSVQIFPSSHAEAGFICRLSPVGCVGPALGDINTPLMSPFLEESGNNRRGGVGSGACVLNQSLPMCHNSPRACRERTNKKSNAAPITLIMACGSADTRRRRTRTKVSEERKMWRERMGRQRQWAEVCECECVCVISPKYIGVY